MGSCHHLWLAVVIGMGGLSACSGGEVALGTPPPTSLGPTPPSIATPVIPEMKKPTTVDPLTQGAYQPMVTLLGGDAEKKTDDDGKKDGGTKSGGKAKQDAACKGKPSWACKADGDKTDGGSKTGGGKTGGGNTGDGKTGGGAGDDPNIVGKKPGDVKKPPSTPPKADDDKEEDAPPPVAEKDEPVASGPAKFELFAANAEGLNGYVVLVVVEHTTGRLLATYWDPKEGWGRKTAVIDDKNKYEGQPAAVVNGSNGNIELFATTVPGEIKRWYWSRGERQWYSSGSWSFSNDQAIGKFLPGIAALYDPNAAVVRVFARTATDQQLRKAEWKSGTTGWSDFVPVTSTALPAGETIASRPSAIHSVLTNDVQVWARTSKGRLVQWAVGADGTTTGNWVHGGEWIVEGEPTVAEDPGAKFLYVFAADHQKRLTQRWWMPGYGWAEQVSSKAYPEDPECTSETAAAYQACEYVCDYSGADAQEVKSCAKSQGNPLACETVIAQYPACFDDDPSDDEIIAYAPASPHAVFNPYRGGMDIYSTDYSLNRLWHGALQPNGSPGVEVVYGEEIVSAAISAVINPSNGLVEVFGLGPDAHLRHWWGGTNPKNILLYEDHSVMKDIEVSAAVALAYPPTGYTGWIGGGGGGSTRYVVCPPGEVVVGFHGLIIEGADLARLGIYCRAPGSTAEPKKIGADYGDGGAGLDVRGYPEFICPGRFDYVNAVAAWVYDSMVVTLVVHCGTIGSDAGKVTLQDKGCSPGSGGYYGIIECDSGPLTDSFSYQSLSLPSGVVLTGLGVFQGDQLDSVSLQYRWITFP